MIRDIFSNTIFARGWLKAWSIYMMIFPFYVFPAGSVQPSDMFIALIMGAYMVLNGFSLNRFYAPVRNKFVNFLIYLCLVNFLLFIFMLGKSAKGLPWFIVNAFYVYNFLVFVFAFVLHQRYGKDFLKATVYSLVLSGALQVILSPFGNTEDLRPVLFFTNPNQLGYYSLIGLTIILTLERSLKLPRTVIYLSFGIFTYFAMLSLSKATIGSLLVLFGVYLLTTGVFSSNGLFKIAGLVLAGVIVITATDFGANFIENFTNRTGQEQPKGVTEWEYRGYDRISNHPYYLVLGAGEGAYNRFDTYIDKHEMHSSVGTIIFSYGIPGTVLFIVFVLSLARGLRWQYVVYMLPLFAYGVTHMGLRFTYFWIALAMFPVMRFELIKQQYFFRKRRIEASKNNYRTNLPEVPAQGAA
jgi:hypothetical protein